MLITKEQQEALIANYNKEGHSRDECLGFIDGVGKTMELIIRLGSTSKSFYCQQGMGIGGKDCDEQCEHCKED